jgi:predicted DCC family thiol-disulfide oxidoreductase YuxK
MRAVFFIIRHDAKRIFSFTPITSPTAKHLLNKHNIPNYTCNTLFLFDHNGWKSHSSAVLAIAKKLSFPVPLLFIGVVVPQWLRDKAYLFIANHRHQIFPRPLSSSKAVTEEYKSRLV